MKAIETERLILRNFEESDYDDVFEFLSQRKEDEFEAYPDITYENGREHLKYRVQNDEFIAIQLKETGNIIGNVYFGNRDFESKELGYIVNKNYQRKGYAKEAITEVLKEAFKSGVHRVYAECDPRNECSWRLLESLNFVREAFFKQNVYFRKDEDGKPVWQDTYVYSLLAESNVKMFDDFLENKLDEKIWFPFYLPQWSSREKSAASYRIKDSVLTLYVSDEQKPWCPEWNGDIRVSNLQSGVFSGTLGSDEGQHHFTDGLVVREEQENQIKFAFQFGYLEMRARCRISEENVAALWLIGTEEEKERSSELCLFELKGSNVKEHSAVIGFGIHPFKDSKLEDCFLEKEFEVDVREWNTYALDWQQDKVDFYLNGELIHSISQSPQYPMQFMLNLYDLANIKNEDNQFDIDYIKVQD